MTLPDFVTPLILSAVFTLGGFTILRMRRGTEELSGLLFLTFVACSLLVVGVLAGRFVERIPMEAAEAMRARAK